MSESTENEQRRLTEQPNSSDTRNGNGITMIRRGNNIQINVGQPQQTRGIIQSNANATTASTSSNGNDGSSSSASGPATTGGVANGATTAPGIPVAVPNQVHGANVRHIHVNSGPGIQFGNGQGITIIRNENGETMGIRQGNQTSIRIPVGARQFTIPVDGGNNVRISGTATANNPNMINPIPIAPLQPQPLPHTKDEEESPEEHDKYRCTICYEFLADPSSCGQCASRFCYSCLVRVAGTRSSANPTIAKCPACRTMLTVEGIVRDTRLKDELSQANITVMCSFKGCHQRLPADAMKEHEQRCDFTPMRCKNATMGCPWHGPRQHLMHHIQMHCPLERVAGFVDQFRHTRADHQAAIISLQQRLIMSNQMTEVNTGLIRRILPSPTNIFDIVNLIYTCTCTTAYFLSTADKWRLFLVQSGAHESRSLVSNFLYMVPTVVTVCRMAVSGYRILLSTNDRTVQHLMDQLELGTLSMTPFLLLLATGLCCLSDGQSSIRWSNYNYFGRLDRQSMRDMATIALLTIHVVTIECDDAGIVAVFLWHCVLLATCFFPPIVLTILGLASGTAEPSRQHVVNAGRSAEVVLFTLRHSAIIGFLGFLPAIDTAIIMQLLRRNLAFFFTYDLVPVSDGIWSSVGSEYFTGFLAIRFSMWAIETKLEIIPWLTIVACMAYPLIHLIMNQMTTMGIKVGALIYREGRAHAQSGQMGIPNAFSIYGTMSFCAYGTILLMLAASIR